MCALQIDWSTTNATVCQITIDCDETFHNNDAHHGLKTSKGNLPIQSNIIIHSQIKKSNFCPH